MERRQRKSRSKIRRLPADLRAKLDEWLLDGSVTHAEAAAALNERLAARGAAERVSRDVVGRYDRRTRALGVRMREARQAAEVWVAKLGAAPQGQVGLLVNEILHTLAFEISLKLKEGELTTESLPVLIGQIKELSLTAQRLEAAASANVKREREVRRLTAEDLARRAEDATGKSQAITTERLRALVAEVYGA